MATRSRSEGNRAFGFAAGPSGPAVDAVASRPQIAIVGWRWPGGETLRAPIPEDPHWRDLRGEALSLSDVVAGQPVAVRVQVLALHRDAISDVVARAAEAVVTNRPQARAIVAAATRLCNELLVR